MGIIPQIIANSIIAGAIYALVALGFNLIYRATNFFNLAHGAVSVVGGYTVFGLYRLLGLPLWIAIICGVLGSGLVGYILEKILFLPLRKRKSSQMVLIVASLGAFTIIQAVIAIIFSSQFQTLFDSSMETKLYQIGGGIITQVQLIILIAALLIMGTLAWIKERTMFGKMVSAISDDAVVARIVGINTNKLIGRVFFIGSAIAGFAGIMIGFDTGLEPTMGMSLLMKGVIAAIVGGVGNIYGGVLGAFLLGFAENFGVWQVSGEWKDAIAFAILIFFLIFRPKGILGKK
ncbi:MAG: Inner-membrane translocator [Candidatus Wolfebacteria bacterium GW2011_GWC2_39_22]|uniref:Inner-membrane translocator n=1 Tax=Candidatus Wolfebacteria bacterium GW2011_GWC2_39_22 TaxID=1619013 RepID=A0A0G0N7X7_9BACT|nr:MAG: Inner-membrane translocator [Candidatus Wolfebacteria bacterium GW2011_GWC2_39_22]HBI25893.1 branched-chain amino acid ABC transporter permease [Candidatus Wolfebacteria bacterium]